MWIKKFLGANVINFAKEDKGGGLDAYSQKMAFLMARN